MIDSILTAGSIVPQSTYQMLRPDSDKTEYGRGYMVAGLRFSLSFGRAGNYLSASNGIPASHGPFSRAFSAAFWR